MDESPRSFRLVDEALAPAWGLQLYDAHQVAREKIENAGYAQPLVRQSPWELLIAPFQWENLSDGHIWSMIGWNLLGLVAFRLLLPLDTSTSTPSTWGEPITNAKSAELWGVTFTPGQAYLANLAVAPLVFAGVGAWEEATYRGVLQIELERSLGQVGGALAAGALFSQAHGPKTLGEFANRTWSGYLFGRLYQETGYDLRKAAAAHAYWDTLLMPVLALVPGVYNPLGFRFTF
jgi:membrane protease YdiL (CAAX protease family)